MLAGLFGTIEHDHYWDWIYSLIEQRPRLTNLNVTIADLMDMPLDQITRFAEKLQEQRQRDIALANAKPQPIT